MVIICLVEKDVLAVSALTQKNANQSLGGGWGFGFLKAARGCS